MRAASSALAASILACACVRPSQPVRPVAPAPTPVEVGTAMSGAAGTSLDGKRMRLADLRARWLVVYFYPVDFSSGGTAEAREFKEDYPHFRKLGAEIVGVSTDHVSSHRDFVDRYKLPFPLLSDEGGAMARAFGVDAQGGATRHVTFVLDRDRVVRKVWQNVRAWGHAAEVLGYLKTLRRDSR
jgi:peroxiredoxin Q/BCP